MKSSRLALFETYGLAIMGVARGVCEVIVNEATDRLHERQLNAAPAVGHKATLEIADELRKVA